MALIDPTNTALALLSTLIHERTGLIYEPSRYDLLADKLASLVAEGRFSSLMDYYYYLKYDNGAGKEWQRVQSALAVNETYFWREYDQIEAAATIIVPALQHQQPGRPVRIWHAASASGEEPYTMAITLTERGGFSNGPVEITATDFNTVALAQARQGIYRPRSFRMIPPDIHQRYFQPLPNNLYRLNDEIRSRVNFTYLNLMDEAGVRQFHSYDMIICRNAFIYFSDQSIQRVLGWFWQALNPQGYLFVAAAESLLRHTNQFDLVEVGNAFAYRKRFAPSEQGVNPNDRPGALRPPQQSFGHDAVGPG